MRKLTLLRRAILAILVTSTPTLANVGAGLEVSKDENRLQNFKYDGRNRFDIDMFDLHQDRGDLYGLSLGYARNVVDTKYIDVLVGGHINPGVLVTDTEDYGARMFYDAGVTPNLDLFDHLRFSAFLGYRYMPGNYFAEKGNLKVDGPVVRLGLSLEL